MAAGARLYRIFNPDSRTPGPLQFRAFGPLERFDHHRSNRPEGDYDFERGVLYLAEDFTCCVVERFGNDHVIRCGNRGVIHSTVNEILVLLDLRVTSHSAMAAGTFTAISSCEDTRKSQAWSRYFYDNPDICCNLQGQSIDGVIYNSAHNGEEAIFLYERADGKLSYQQQDVERLDAPSLRPTLLAIAQRTGMTVAC